MAFPALPALEAIGDIKGGDAGPSSGGTIGPSNRSVEGQTVGAGATKNTGGVFFQPKTKSLLQNPAFVLGGGAVVLSVVYLLARPTK